MRIKRSSWKFPYNNFKYYYFNSETKVYSRNITLTSKYLNKVLNCHKGKIVGKLFIEAQHLGHKLGEFFVTKVLGDRIAYRKRQKLLLKRNKGKLKSLKK